MGVAVVLTFLFWHKPINRPTLRLCTWSNYFSEPILEEFTKRTGIRVEVSYISSNEELLAKMKAGASGYDLIQPSDYMVGQMIKLNMLTPMDHAQLTQYSHIDHYYHSLPYDPGLKFSVPFVRGITGIIVNTEKVALKEGENVGWELLFNSPDPRHTSMLDDMREVFAAALMMKGHNINETNAENLKEAQKDILAAKDKISMFTSEPLQLVVSGQVNIAHAFSTHGIQAALENPKIKFFIPKEGAVVWTDNFAIPTTSKMTKEAHAFVDYILHPEVAAQVIAYNKMASPNRTARNRLPASEVTPVAYPSDEVMTRLFFMQDLGTGLGVVNRLWTEVKS